MAIHGDEMRVCPEIYKQLLPTGLSMGFMISFVSIGSLALLRCIIVAAIVFTCAPFLIRLVTGSGEKEIIHTATRYLKVNSALYFLPAMICIFRNSMQGFGDNKTPLISSSIELVGKVLIAFFLSPVIGYYGIIISEPLVWGVMILPLFAGMKKFGVLSETEL